MAFNRKDKNKELQKHTVYVKWVNEASLYFTKQPTFDIQKFSDYMKKIYTKYESEQLDIDPSIENTRHSDTFYEVRHVPMLTQMNMLYPKIFELFSACIDTIFNSVLDKDEKSLEFVDLCKKSVNPKTGDSCSVTELKVSKHNNGDIKEALEIKNIGLYETTPSKNATRCKLCFKYSPEIGTIKVTDSLLKDVLLDKEKDVTKEEAYKLVTQLHVNERNGQKQLSNANPLYKKIYDFLEKPLFQMSITVRGIKIPTLIFLVRQNQYYEWYGNLFNYLSIYHISPKNWKGSEPNYSSNEDNIAFILDEVKHVWENLSKEADCYYLHWLLSNATPFKRGSAGFSKIILNAALLRCKLTPVNETKTYLRMSDWVAMFSPTFEEYYVYKHIMFEPDLSFITANSVEKDNTLDSHIKEIILQNRHKYDLGLITPLYTPRKTMLNERKSKYKSTRRSLHTKKKTNRKSAKKSLYKKKKTN